MRKGNTTEIRQKRRLDAIRDRMRLRELKIINSYAKYVIKKDTLKLNMEDWAKIGDGIIKTDNKVALAQATKKTIMQNKPLANLRVLELLEKMGVDEKKPIELLLKAEEIAKEKGNSADLIKISDRYIDLMDLRPQKYEIQFEERGNFRELLPEEVQKEIKIKRKIELNDDNRK